MYKKWSKYQAAEVRTGTDQNGNRLLVSFARDYKEVFGVDICPNCNGFNQKFINFLNKTKPMSEKKKSGYVLKKTYQNIPLEFGSSVFVNNENMTDEYGAKLLKSHPKGEGLFDILPAKDAYTVNGLTKDNNRDALVEIAKGFGIEDLDGTKKELATLIVEAQSNEE